MAEAIICGIIKNKLFLSKNIFASDKDIRKLNSISKNYSINVSQDNIKAVWSGDIIVLAVKPQIAGDILGQIKDHLDSSKLFISIAAGISLAYLESRLKNIPAIRVMPNNPCIIGEGMSVLAKGRWATQKDLRLCEKIFSSLGKCIALDEKYLNAVTALSGSGPAFIYKIIEGLLDGGAAAGLPKKIASTLVLQTALGAIKTIYETGREPKELIEMVASPNGTTIEGLKIMDEAKINQIMCDTVKAAYLRAVEMQAEFEKQ